jgi:thiamine-phosphate pyrophosphorylase
VTSLRGLYAVTPYPWEGHQSLADAAAAALAGGARILQYRSKGADGVKRAEEARSLVELCRAADALSIVNDDPDLAAEVEADGVHLGRGDAEPRWARRRLGRSAVIGVSCYDRLERAREAQAAGADYAAFGRFFASRTKPAAVQAHSDLLRRARRELAIPLVAIGGITPENGALLLAAGADMLAVVQGLFGATDIRSAARSFAELFSRHPG